VSTPVITTKLFIPPPQINLVSRPRLINKFTQGLDGKLTLVSAPAGFGKSTLLSEGIHKCGKLAAWISLDNGDNDQIRFLTYLIAALQQIDPGIGTGILESLRSSQPPDSEQLLAGLINDVAEAKHPFIIILDDYHVITHTGIHDILFFLLENLPPRMHLVISSRADPPWPLSRWRVHGDISEIRTQDLRFTVDEAAIFFNHVMGYALTPEEVAALETRAEGWIAGLQMAAISMKSKGDIPGFIQSFTGSHHFIFDFFIEEVLDRLPLMLKSFLLKTSILERMNASLCDAVTGANDSQEMLVHLEQTNLFIIPLDEERRWYRYHRLFSDLLQKQLHQVIPYKLPELHERACLWYEHNDHLYEAIEHAFEMKDHDRSADLIEKIAESIFMRSEVATFLNWVEKLPEKILKERPTLGFLHVWALLFTGRPIDVVRERIHDLSEIDEQLSGKMPVLKAFIDVIQGRVLGASEIVRQALDQLPASDRYLRGIASWILGLSQAAGGDINAAVQTLKQAARMNREVGNIMIAVAAQGHLAQLLIHLGRLYDAKTNYEEALALATDQDGKLLPVAADALLGLGGLSYQWNDLQKSENFLMRGIELTERINKYAAIEGYIHLARLQNARGDHETAGETLEKAGRLAEQFDITDLDDFIVSVHQVRLWISQGNLAAASRWVEGRDMEKDISITELESSDDLTGFNIHKHDLMVLARFLIAKDENEKALVLLDSLLEVMQRRERVDIIIEIQVLRALIFHSSGDTRGALASIQDALSLGEAGSFVRTFLDEGPVVAQLLSNATIRGISPAYVNKILKAFELDESLPLVTSERVSAERELVLSLPDGNAFIEPLSGREVDVLGLIAEGLSNKEIAQQLFLSLSTIKWHTGNIYGKLGVNNRTQAVAKARELNILS
jgi:LuxR family maltose regulon positive regulatory protein